MNQLGPSAVYLEFGGASNAAGKEFTFQNWLIWRFFAQKKI